eukprot:COSAG04_NODE_18733_length_433_cov_20.113772_1_plen_93_part_01
MWIAEREGTTAEARLARIREELHEEAERNREAAMRKVVAKIQHTRCGTALTAWMAFAQSSKRMRYVAGRVVLRMQQGVLAGALGGWSEYVAWS